MPIGPNAGRTLVGVNAGEVQTNFGSETTAAGALAVGEGGTGATTAADARTNLGLGTAATASVGSFLQVANNLSDLLTASVARVNIGLSTFPVGFYQGTTMSDAQVMLRIAAPFTFSFPVGMSGSTVAIGVSCTASSVFLFQKGGVTFGACTATSASVVTFTAAAVTTFTVSDVLTILAPSTADSDLADIGMTLLATR